MYVFLKMYAFEYVCVNVGAFVGAFVGVFICTRISLCACAWGCMNKDERTSVRLFESF